MDKPQVDLLGPLRIIHGHLTETLCEAVFEDRRVDERRRIWTLHVMAGFWLAVVVRSPVSIRQALDETRQGTGGYPLAKSAPESFFERAQKMQWQFFEGLLSSFTQSVLKDHGPAFEEDLRRSLHAFPEVWVVDGSRLDVIAHRLKVLWDERLPLLPGSVLALYDLYRGVPRRLRFAEDAYCAEVPALQDELDLVPRGTLLLGDRAYCSHRLFGDLTERGIWAVVRLTESISIEEEKRLSRTKHDDGILRDTLVIAGTKQRPSERQHLRLIVWKKGRKEIRLLTNVLDPQMLPATAAIALYQRRWKVERMFYDLKKVLNLRRFYAANVNAVAMQVHAAAIVYVALRVAQAQIARTQKLRPEKFSVEKLFPRVAEASAAFVNAQRGADAMRRANPGVRLVEPDWSKEGFASVSLDSVLVEPRSPKRRKRRRSPAGPRAASLHRFVPRRH